MKREAIFLILFFSTLAIAIPEPQPANATKDTNESYGGYSTNYNYTPAGGAETNYDLVSSMQSQAWAGFYGNLSAFVVLKDLSGDTFHSWSPATVTGTVYATTSSNPDWASVNNDISASTVDELWDFGDWSDNASSSFTANANTEFSIGTGLGSVTIAANTRDKLNTNTAGAPSSGIFEEVLLSDSAAPSKQNIIFTCIMDGLQTAFDSQSTAHFQLLVPNNQVNATQTDSYYFYTQIN